MSAAFFRSSDDDGAYLLDERGVKQRIACLGQVDAVLGIARARIDPVEKTIARVYARHIQLGGDASYFGKTVRKAAFGDPLRRVNRTDILATIDLMNAASVLALALCCAVRLTLQR